MYIPKNQVAILLSVMFALLLQLLQAPQAIAKQGGCLQQLQQADRLYNEGRLQEVNAAIGSCINGLEGADREDAYRLKVLSYLFMDEITKAEQEFQKLLEFAPEYQPLVTDPQELHLLYTKFRTAPIMAIGVIGGINRVDIVTEQQIDISSNTFVTPKGYTPNIGIQAGLALDFYINKSLHIGLDILYNQQRFTSAASLFNFTDLTASEQQRHLLLPVVVKYTFLSNKKYRPSIGIGAAGAYMFSGSIRPSRIITGEVNDPGAEERTVNFFDDINGQSIDLRKRQQVYGVAEAGLRVKVPMGFLSGMLRYYHGFNSIVQLNNLYAQQELLYEYGFVSDNFKLNQLAFSLSFQRALYNPKKIKK